MVALETGPIRIRIQEALYGPPEIGDWIVVCMDIFELAPPAQVPRVIIVRTAVYGDVRVQCDDGLDFRGKRAHVDRRLAAVGESDESYPRAIHFATRFQIFHFSPDIVRHSGDR